MRKELINKIKEDVKNGYSYEEIETIILMDYVLDYDLTDHQIKNLMFVVDTIFEAKRMHKLIDKFVKGNNVYHIYPIIGMCLDQCIDDFENYVCLADEDQEDKMVNQLYMLKQMKKMYDVLNKSYVEF
jgi:hypothetical protein